MERIGTARIRRAALEDAPAIARVDVESWRIAYLGLVPASVLNRLSVAQHTRIWQASLAEGHRSTSRTWVLESDDGMLGFASAGPTRDEGAARRRIGELYAIYLLPIAWGHGLGSALLDVAQRDLARRGFTAVTLWVLRGNTRARRFYELSGLAVDGAEKPVRLGDAVLPAVRYRRAL